ncbi:MAG TPA: hypothetical protein P5084_00550 [Paludibacter sp.]|nr:hypothetical protein [Paludibacter sp.]
MAKLNKNQASANIESNINEAFILIDGYLPKRYTERVQELVGNVSKTYIRNVKSTRQGPAKIIAALKKVAEEEKAIFN